MSIEGFVKVGEEALDACWGGEERGVGVIGIECWCYHCGGGIGEWCESGAEERG